MDISIESNPDMEFTYRFSITSVLKIITEKGANIRIILITNMKKEQHLPHACLQIVMKHRKT